MTEDYVKQRPRLQPFKLAPEVYRAMAAFDRAAGSGLDKSLAELVKLRASQLNGCAFCVDMHAADATTAGEDPRRLHAVAVWRDAPFFTAKERAALALTEAATRLTDGEVPDAVWDEAAAHFDDTELSHLLAQIAAINSWNRFQVPTRALPRDEMDA